MKTRVLAIDPSLSNTGYAYRDGDDIFTGRISTASMRSAERLDYIVRSIDRVMAQAAPDIVAYEGYAMGIKGGKVFDIGELGGLLKHHFWKAGKRVLLVPPASMKMFVAGKGNADKVAVANAIERELGIVLRSDDESDAVGVLMVGEAFTDGLHLVNGVPGRRNEALQGCHVLPPKISRRVAA